MYAGRVASHGYDADGAQTDRRTDASVTRTVTEQYDGKVALNLYLPTAPFSRLFPDDPWICVSPIVFFLTLFRKRRLGG